METARRALTPASVGTERKGTTELPGGGDNSRENFPGEKKNGLVGVFQGTGLA